MQGLHYVKVLYITNSPRAQSKLPVRLVLLHVGQYVWGSLCVMVVSAGLIPIKRQPTFTYLICTQRLNSVITQSDYSISNDLAYSA